MLYLIEKIAAHVLGVEIKSVFIPVCMHACVNSAYIVACFDRHVCVQVYMHVCAQPCVCSTCNVAERMYVDMCVSVDVPNHVCVYAFIPELWLNAQK
jgi:hypothetical protein